jgi:hypothetical protein
MRVWSASQSFSFPSDHLVLTTATLALVNGTMSVYALHRNEQNTSILMRHEINKMAELKGMKVYKNTLCYEMKQFRGMLALNMLNLQDQNNVLLLNSLDTLKPLHSIVMNLHWILRSYLLVLDDGGTHEALMVLNDFESGNQIKPVWTRILPTLTTFVLAQNRISLRLPSEIVDHLLHFI